MCALHLLQRIRAKRRQSLVVLAGFIACSILLAGLSWLGLQAYLTIPTNEEVFEQNLGIEITADVEILRLKQRGLGDFMELSVCFRASSETIQQIVQSRTLTPASAPVGEHPCVGTPSSSYTRDSGMGLGLGIENQERVNGFGTTEQTLHVNARTQTAFYHFLGID